MKRTFCVVVLLLGACFCPFVAAQHQQRSVVGSRNNASSNREMNGRMISTGGRGNKVQNDDSDNGDSAFDNGPSPGRDSSEITFPIDDFYHPTEEHTSAKPVIRSRNVTKESRWKQIPLDALVKFGTEPNLSNFFKNYVKNAKVVKDNETLEEYLADSQGAPIVDAKNEKVVLAEPSPPKVIEPSVRISTMNYPSPFDFGGKGRAGGAIIESRSKINLDQAMTRGEKQTKSSLSLPVCSPEITTVPVPLDTLKVDPSMLIIPKCLKVERCGGCCLSDLTVCEAERTDTVKHTVTILGYDGENDGALPQLQFVSTSTVEVERHKSCKCKCRTKREHCRSHHHRYEVNQCSCVCTNHEAHQRCMDNPENRFWDNETCQCTCQEVKECSSGYIFDLNTCDCQRQPSEFEARQMKTSQFNRSRVSKTRRVS